MSQFKIELSAVALAKIQLAVDDFNVQTGQSLTLEEWVILSLSQKAIEKELTTDIDALKRAHDAELPRRIDARRRALLSELGNADAIRIPPEDTG